MSIRPNHRRERKQSLLQDERDAFNEVSRFLFFAIRFLDRLGHEVEPPEHKDHYRNEISFRCLRCFKIIIFDTAYNTTFFGSGNYEKVWRAMIPVKSGNVTSYLQYIFDYNNPQQSIDVINDIDQKLMFCDEIPECYINRQDFRAELDKIPDALSKYFQHCFLHKINFKYIVKGYLTRGQITFTRARTCALEGKCNSCKATFGARIEGLVMTFALGDKNGRSHLIEQSGSTPYPSMWLEEASKRIRNETNITLKNPDYAHFSCTRLEILE